MGNMPVIKDLIVDMDAVHWTKMQRVTPWLINREPVPEREYLVDRESMVDVTQSMACIQCGACVSDCLSMEVDPLFIGPAALAKAYRFVGDPRDAQQGERLRDLAEDPHGLYDCTHCFKCIEACPKGVAPMSQIMRLRRRAGTDHGIVDRNNGERHEAAFARLVKDHGLLVGGRAAAALLRRRLVLRQVRAERRARAARLAARDHEGALRRKVTPMGALKAHNLPKDDLRQIKRIFSDVEGRGATSSTSTSRATTRTRRARRRRRASPPPGRTAACPPRPGSPPPEGRSPMKVAYWPGCVSRGFTPELHGSMANIAPLLDLELVELDRASCCGAGVIAEHNQELADTLNARTFALAQQVAGAELMMNICSTCQGAQTECQERLDANAEYREHVNGTLAPRDSPTAAGSPTRTSSGSSSRSSGSRSCASRVRRPLTNLKVGPFYGCYIVRPTPTPGHRRRAPARHVPRAGHRGARRHRHRVRGHVQVLRLPHHHDEQGRLAQAGRPPPRRRGRRRRRLPRHPVPALPSQPRPAAAARRAGRRARARHAGAAPPAAHRAGPGPEPKELGMQRHVVKPAYGHRLDDLGHRRRRRRLEPDRSGDRSPSWTRRSVCSLWACTARASSSEPSLVVRAARARSRARSPARTAARARSPRRGTACSASSRIASRSQKRRSGSCRRSCPSHVGSSRPT